MMILNPMAVAIFVFSWTIGMAAMMFPAIVPMVLLYNRMVSKGHNDNNVGYGAGSIFRGSYHDFDDSEQKKNGRLSLVFLASLRPTKTSAFVGTYLLVWASTGLVLLVFWSVLMNTLFSAHGLGDFAITSGILLIMSGMYQFSSLKKKCLGYCESPLGFFMKRWKGDKLTGGLIMGLYHGVYCLGCCWPYFLLMISLGWMNILWMGLFAGIIFAEKNWPKGIYIARAAGIVFMFVGLLSLAGFVSITAGNGSISLHQEMGDMVKPNSNLNDGDITTNGNMENMG
ncbi:MAG: DUF2182 domain-containing protein [Nitrosopumilus sp.]|nr:DUF2182 domain-containing protein [Nitrosopumilus sp.]